MAIERVSTLSMTGHSHQEGVTPSILAIEISLDGKYWPSRSLLMADICHQESVDSLNGQYWPSRASLRLTGLSAITTKFQAIRHQEALHVSKIDGYGYDLKVLAEETPEILQTLYFESVHTLKRWPAEKKFIKIQPQTVGPPKKRCCLLTSATVIIVNE
jgi:hypothetical protein